MNTLLLGTARAPRSSWTNRLCQWEMWSDFSSSFAMKKIPLQRAALLAQSQVTGVTFPTFPLPGPQRPRVGLWSLVSWAFLMPLQTCWYQRFFFSAQAEDWSLLPPSPLGVWWCKVTRETLWEAEGGSWVLEWVLDVTHQLRTSQSSKCALCVLQFAFYLFVLR